ncbi:discoidin domain-containing protein [Paenibacillus nasutitermitis]|uniref:F5/8 type C domain-containing protein n=1 Tax=Paenibacillus nasutitermitis TaxID=1652958 RepID=A0A916YL47_9BACL|nr:discoidin domain-containing protein [Paenibacillus nasutitermitis]GGD49717.1 hypothetical protein GCM10010911_04060 [Paenibacillus nasutitermitis]
MIKKTNVLLASCLLAAVLLFCLPKAALAVNDIDIVASNSIVNANIVGLGWNNINLWPEGSENRWPEEMFLKSFTNEDWNKFFGLLAWTNPALIRQEVRIEDYQPTQNNINWNNEQMNRLRKLLDKYQEFGIKVYLNVWRPPAWDRNPYNADNFAQEIADLVYRMRVTEGYDNIVGVATGNEPDQEEVTQADYPDPYWAVYPKLSAKLTTLGIKDVIKIYGPETASYQGNDTTIDSMLNKYGNVLDMYTDHIYTSDYTNAVNGLSARASSLNSRYGHDVPVLVTEYAPNGLHPSRNTDTLYGGVLYDTGQLIARGLNKGVDGFLRWSWSGRDALEETVFKAQTGLDHWDPDYYFKPSDHLYYPHAVQSRYINSGWNVLSTNVLDGIGGIYASVLRSPDNAQTTVLLTNINDSAKTAGLNLSALPGAPGSLNNVMVTGPKSKMVSGTSVSLTGGAGTITLPPNSIVTLTTLPLGNLNDPINLYSLARPYNLAWKKTVTAGTSVENHGWNKSKAVDGQRHSLTDIYGWTSLPSSSNHTEWIQVDLGDSYAVNEVNLFARNDSGHMGDSFPIDFTIQTSNDNTNWTTVVTRTNYPLPAAAQNSFTFATQTARYVKIVGTKLRPVGTEYRMTLAEIEVYANGSPSPAPSPAPTPPPGSNLVTNPGFEMDGSTNGLAGWITTGANPEADGSQPGGHTGSYELVHYKGSAYQVYTYQKLKGLSNGIYTLKAWVKNDFGGQGTAYMQAKNFGGAAATVNIPTSSAWTQISIPNIQVTNGECTIGFYSNSPSSWYLVDDVEFNQVNVALNKTVTASSSVENFGWAKTSVVDGQTNSTSSSMGWSSSSSNTVNHTEWVKVDLGAVSAIHHINLYSRSDELGRNFPVDFTIQTSTDNTTWTTVAARTNYTLPAAAKQSFSFATGNARYVKIEGTNLRMAPNNTYNMAFAEIEVY